MAGRAGASALVAALALLGHVAAARAAPTPVAVISDDTPVARELSRRVLLDAGFQRSSPERARLLWLIGELSAERWQLALARAREGASLLVIPGPRGLPWSRLGLASHGPSTDRAALQSAAEVSGVALLYRNLRYALSVGRRSAPATARVRARQARRIELLDRVVWESAPQVGRRWQLKSGALVRALVREHDDGGALLVYRPLGRGELFVFGIALTDPSNRDLVLWPYFNYLLYLLSTIAAALPAQRYGDWPSAPVPGSGSLWIIALLIGAAWIVTLALFFKARRYSRKHPEMLTDFFSGTQAAGPGRRPRSAWQSIGFSRPLAGFLTLTAALFLLFVPFYWLTNIVIPNDVQPFPQARGMWDFAWEALQMAWFLFDAGTFVAFVKYFAEYRVKDRAEAVRSAQFFVWWQLLTGLVQVSLASLAAVVILPNTSYGYTSSFVILVALGQYPGFFGVVTFFFQAYQRFDYNIGLDLLSDWVLRFVLQIPCVLLFRRWGAAHPEYGEAFGAAVGIGVGFYLSAVATFGIGVLLYRRLGLRLLPLFLAHFDWATAKRMLWYGLRVVLGKFFFRAAQAIDKVMISVLLLNYTEWLGLKGQIHYNLMFLFPIAYRFFETAMAALSESYSNGKRTLTQYYLSRFFQVGSLYTAIFLSVMIALGPTFVHQVMDPQWARAADYLVIAACIGAFYAPAWLSDMLQKGAGRPGLFAVVLGLEQVVRIALFYLLIPLFQFNGYYLALLATIGLKVCGAWVVNHLVILRLRIFPWQMFIAPAIAGLVNFFLWRGMAGALELSGPVPVTIFFFSASLASFFVCFFVAGLAGGFDRGLADELDSASRMTGPLVPLTRLFFFAARAGWRFSPLHDRFAVTIRQQAMREAEELQSRAP